MTQEIYCLPRCSEVFPTTCKIRLDLVSFLHQGKVYGQFVPSPAHTIPATTDHLRRHKLSALVCPTGITLAIDSYITELALIWFSQQTRS